METVTDRRQNPFGMRPPTDDPYDGTQPATFGYGDPNADFHLVGDHPGVHGGADADTARADADAARADDLTAGVPFSSPTVAPLRAVLAELGFLESRDGMTVTEDLFASYVHPVTPPGDREPTAEEYAAVERFFDAEFRAINAHVVLPVGERAVEHVLREYTAQAGRFGLNGSGNGGAATGAEERDDPGTRGVDVASLHARELRGRGYLVVPVRDPASWSDGDATALIDRLAAIRGRDYRQTSDLGRFIAGADPYEVR